MKNLFIPQPRLFIIIISLTSGVFFFSYQFVFSFFPFLFGNVFQQISWSFLVSLWILFLSIYKFTGIPIGRKALARGTIYLLLFSFFIFYVTYFHQYVQFVFAATDINITLWINNTNNNQTFTYPAASNVTAQTNLTNIPITLKRNGTVVNYSTTGNTFDIRQLGVADYNYTANTSANATHNAAQRSIFLRILPTTATVNVIGAFNITYGTTTTLSCISTHTDSSRCSLFLNLTTAVPANYTTNNNTAVTLNAGWFNVTANSTSTQNYSATNSPNSSMKIYFQVSQASTTNHLSLNGTEGNASYIPSVNNTINATGWNSANEGTFTLYRNGTPLATTSGTNFVTNISTGLSRGDYNYTLTFSDSNFTSTTAVSYFAFVGESNPPLWQNQGTNDTDNSILQGESINLTAQGKDDTALDWATLATNESGSWRNYTQATSWWNSSWPYRKNITINNSANSNTLANYQVFVNVTYNSNMSSTFNDLRFTYYNSTSGNETGLNYGIEKNVTSSYAEVWINVSQIPANSYQTVYMYYGNLGASSTGNLTNVFENIFTQPSFESATGWTYTESDSPGGCAPTLPSSLWSTEKSNSYYQYCGFSEFYTGEYYGREYQTRTFPSGYSYVIRFDVNTATVTSPYGIIEVLDGSTVVWSTTQQNVILLNQETSSITSGSHSVYFGTHVTGAATTRYANAYFDNIRVRKYSSPAPTYSIGSQEVPIGSSPISMIKNSNWQWSNFTWSNSSVAQETTVGWRIYYNDTSGNENVTDIQTFLIRETTPPQWSSNTSSIVSSYSSTNSQFNITWTDNVAVNTVFIEGNWSGSPVNYTPSQSGSVYYYSTILPAGNFNWRSFANDTSDNWNVSHQWNFTVAKNKTVLILSNNTALVNTSQLVGYWRFENNADDYSGYDNDGTISGATLTTGMFGNAYGFDGVDDNITVSDSDSLDITGNMSIGLWMKADSIQTTVLRYDDGVKNENKGGDGGDDGISKWLNIADVSKFTGNGSLWIYGQARDCNSTASGDYRLRVNDVVGQTINFNWCDIFGLDAGSALITSNFEWTRFEIPSSWLVSGENKFNFWDSSGSCSWGCANWYVGADTNNYYNRSAWCSNCGLGTDPPQGHNMTNREAMIFLTNSRIIDKNNAYGIDLSLTVNTSANMTLMSYVNNRGTETYIGNNSWNHILTTFNGTSLNVYVNGSLVSSNVVNNLTSISTNSNPVKIGGYFNGTIDEVQIWNRSLTADEISELYQSKVTYPTTTTFTGSNCKPSGGADVSCSLWRNNTNVTATENATAITLPAGWNYYVYNTTGGQNYTSTNILLPLNVSREVPQLTLTLDGSSSTSQSRTYPNSTLVIGSETNQGDSDATYNLYWNSTSLTNNSGITLPAGTTYISLNQTTLAQNWTTNSTTITLTISKAQPVIALNNNTASVNTSQLAGYWRFEEGSETVAYDSSGWDKHGNLKEGLNVTVSTGNDDAEETVSNGGMYLDSSDLELINDGVDQVVGIRFQVVAIPQGATITNAYIEFTVDEVSSTSTSLTIHGENSDSAVGFGSNAYNISSRPNTTASVAWNDIPAWNTVGEKKQTSNISSIVQEIVNRGGWSISNSMVFKITGSGKRVAVSYDNDATLAPLLVVNYTNNNAAYYVTGVFGSALQFDGVNDYVEISSINPTTAITVEAWVKSASSSGYSGLWQIVSKYNAYILGTDSTGGKNMCFIIHNVTDWYDYNNCYTVNDPQNWHHFVGTYDSSTGIQTLYVDGTLQITKTVTGTIRADTGPIHIAHREVVAVGSGHFNGTIDEVQIWNRSLTADEIAELYQSRTSYGTTTTFTGSNCKPSGGSDVSCSLWRNTTNVTSSENATAVTLPAGWHYYIYNTSGGQNYTLTNILLPINVSQATPTVSVIGVANITYGTSTTLACTSTNGDSGAKCSLFLNLSTAAPTNYTASNNTAITLNSAWFNVTANSTSTQNYSSTNSPNSSMLIYFQVSQAPVTVSLYLNGSQANNNSYFTTRDANFTVVSSVSGKTVKLDTNITGWTTASGTTPLFNYTRLNTAGTYNVTGYFSGDANYSASSATYYATVNQLAMAPVCSAGGPYATSSTVTVVGNTSFNDSSTASGPVQINITKSGVVQSSRNVTSSPEGKFTTQFTGLSAGSYVANISATSGTYTGTCTSSFSITSSASCSTPTKNLTLSGYAFDYNTGSAISSGTVTVTIKETEDTSSVSFSGGYWAVSFQACIVSDTRYTLGIKITDPNGKSSYTQTGFISP